MKKERLGGATKAYIACAINQEMAGSPAADSVHARGVRCQQAFVKGWDGGPRAASGALVAAANQRAWARQGKRGGACAARSRHAPSAASARQRRRAPGRLTAACCGSGAAAAPGAWSGRRSSRSRCRGTSSLAPSGRGRPAAGGRTWREGGRWVLGIRRAGQRRRPLAGHSGAVGLLQGVMPECRLNKPPKPPAHHQRLCPQLVRLLAHRLANVLVPGGRGECTGTQGQGVTRRAWRAGPTSVARSGGAAAALGRRAQSLGACSR